MLSEKVVIVTGAGQGLGEAVATELGRYGATVVVNDLGTSPEGEGAAEAPARETAAAIRDDGGTALAHFGDVSDLAYTDRLVADTIAEYGRVDGAVNFAGIIRNRPITEMSRDDWDDVLRVHLGGHFSLLRALTVQWTSRHDGGDLDTERSFLGVASRSALGGRNQSNYSAAKAGILGFGRAMAQELKPAQIRVNTLMPAGGSRQNEYFDGHDPSSSPSDPRKIAPAVAFLLSDRATGVTGCTVRAAGDRIGIVADPKTTTTAVHPGGWTPEAVAECFDADFAASETLDRTGSLRERVH